MDDPSKLLTLIVPGYLTIWVYRTLRPNRRRSDLELTLWAVLWSSLLTLVTSYAYPPLARWIHSLGIGYLGQGSLARVLLASGIGFILGGALSATLKWLSRQERFKEALRWLAEHWGINLLSNFKESRVWNQVMARPAGRAWALVTLQSGTRYVGQVEQYTLDPNIDQLELHLVTYAQVITDQPSGNDQLVPAEGFSDIWIPASQLSTVQFFDDDAQALLGEPAEEPAALAVPADQVGPEASEGGEPG